MEKVFFKSDLVMSQWDTWLHFHDGINYLYYLAELNSKARWAGFGVACSSDGVSWQDKGVCLYASDRMVSFLGTGSVWRSPSFATDKTFICNYSEYHRNCSTANNIQNSLTHQALRPIHTIKF